MTQTYLSTKQNKGMLFRLLRNDEIHLRVFPNNLCNMIRLFLDINAFSPFYAHPLNIKDNTK